MAIAHHFARPFCQFPAGQCVQWSKGAGEHSSICETEIAPIPAARVLNIYMLLRVFVLTRAFI